MDKAFIILAGLAVFLLVLGPITGFVEKWEETRRLRRRYNRLFMTDLKEKRK